MTESNPLKDYRDRNHLTQEALAKKIGVTSITVSRWETGARKIDRGLVSRVANVTGLPPRTLRPDLAELLGDAA